MTNVTLNNNMNGIEIRFTGKPAADVLSSLKENGFRWSGKQKMWYAKQNERRLAFAKSIDSSEFSESSISDVIKNKTEQNPTYDLWEMTRTDGIENNYEKYRIHDCKEIAAIIRKHIRERFRMCRWSVTSDYNSINVELKSSPFAKDSDELAAIVHYVYIFAQSYNYDNSDSMTDYFDVNFYGVYESSIVDYDYEQTEMTVEMMNVSNLFRERKSAFEIAEKERAEKEFAERQARYEIECQESKRREAVRKARHDEIEAAYSMLAADYFVLNAVTSRINKMDSVQSIVDYAEKERAVCHVTREVYLPEAAYRLFENQLLDDYSFLSGMGGTATDDLRVQSMKDYEMMEQEERNTVKWHCESCVAVFCGNELKLVINPEGFSYARYTYLVDAESRVVDKYHDATGISSEEYERNLAVAETITDVSTDIILKNDLKDVWDNDGFDIYRALMKEWIYSHKDFKFSVGVIRAVEIERLKVALYRIYTEVIGISEQFKCAGLMQGQRITLVYISDFGGLVVSRVTFDSVEYGKYAQYDHAVKLIFTPENKRNLHYQWFYRELLVFDGWFDLPESVLWEVSEGSIPGVTVKHSKFLSCDRKQYDAVLDYLKSRNIEPIINTYKPQF